MPAPASFISAVLYTLAISVLLSPSLASASDPIVRIFGIGQGYVVPPDEPFKIQYRVTPDVPGDHFFYLDNALVLTRNANEIDRDASGVYSLTYPTGLVRGRVLELRICVDPVSIDPCDQVSIRAGEALSPAQTIEITPNGTAGHVPAQTAFDIDYTILKPTLSDQVFFIDGELRGRRTASSPQSGVKTIRYPGGLENGEKRLLRFCLDEDPILATCGYAEVTGGQPPDGLDAPDPFWAEDLPDHYQTIADCSPVCGYYANIYYGDPGVSWIPERGDGLPDGLRMDLYYSTTDGQLDTAAPPSTLILYAHSAGSDKESLLERNQSLLKNLLRVADSGMGVVIAAVDFRHPLKQLEDDFTPVSVNDLSYAVQFARHYAAALNIHPEDIFIVGTSLGAGVAIHAAVREIANPTDSSPVRQTSSRIRGVITRDGQTSFSPQWFRTHFLESPAGMLYQTDLLDDEQRLIYGHAPAGVNSDSPLMALLYTGRFIGSQVTVEEYLNQTVDLIHLPNYGLAMEEQYRLYGIAERIRVQERYAGNFGRDAARFIAQNRLGRE